MLVELSVATGQPVAVLEHLGWVELATYADVLGRATRKARRG
jgi:hypothetical protein